MCIRFTNGTLPLDMLSHLPPLPIVIDYWSMDTVEDDSGILHAIQLRDRVRRIVLQAPSHALDRLIVPMDQPFPTLESLSLSSTTGRKEGTKLKIPGTFLAPNLRHLTSHGACLPMRLPLFASSVSLVTLKLTDIAAPGYFTPEDLVTQLQHLPLLEELSVEFSIPMPRPSAEGELLREPLTLTTLPSLKWLVFRGVGAYLEGLLARISSPLLERFNVTLFTQLTFTLPHLSRFTRTTEGLRHHPGGANVIFDRESVSFLVVGSESENNRQFGDGPFSLRITCKPFDWQVIAATQVCGALEPILSAVEEEVTLVLDGLPPDWRDAVDDVVWRELLGPFRSAKRLRVSCSRQCCSSLAPELSSSAALESYRARAGLLIPGLVLPALRHLEPPHDVVETGHTEAPSRERPSHPVVHPPPPPPPLTQVERAAHSTGSFEVIEGDSDDLPPPLVSDPVPAKRNWFRRAVVDRVWKKRLGPRTTRAGS